MQPFSFTSLKIVHDQQIQESMKRNRQSAEWAASRRASRQRLARFSQPAKPACICVCQPQMQAR
jgi:hypothetical protein